MRWLADRSSRFLYRGWGDEAVIYDTLTGDTHLLEPLAFEIFALLRQKPCACADVARAIEAHFAIAPQDDILAATEMTLRRLETIGIAVAARP